MTRVWVTRDEPGGGPLSAALIRAGLEPVCEPVIQRRLTADLRPLVAGLGAGDWLVLTSRYLVDVVDARAVACQVAVVGEASREAAVARGLRVDLVSDDGTGAGLWRRMRPRVGAGTRVCYPRSSRAEPPPEFPGATVTSPVVYSTMPRDFDRRVAASVAAAAVASPSAAEALAPLGALPPLAAIGPTTSDAIRRCGLTVWLQSPEPTLASLAEAIAQGLSRQDRRDATGPSPGPRR
jgi:uroporphyrinogen-III synthase